LITISARFAPGHTLIEVTGHGRDTPGDLDGARACTAVSVATETCVAYLNALAQQDPEHLRVEITQE
jgi:uncharacterized protein YsxB (DUF464 family)